MKRENDKKLKVPKELMDRWENLTPDQVLGFVQGYLFSGHIWKDSQELMKDPDFLMSYFQGTHIAKSERRYKIKFTDAAARFERLKALHRGQIPQLRYKPPEQRYTEMVARRFLREKMNHHLPYTMPTKEDVYQEAYVGYLLALKSFHPWKGTPDFHLRDAIEKHLFKVYQKAKAKQRKSENKKFQLRYIPDYSEGFMEPEPEVFSKMDLVNDDEYTITNQRYGSREHFETYDEQEYQDRLGEKRYGKVYDEQEYNEPPRIELRDGTEHDVYFIGSQLFINTDKRSPRGYKVIEKIGCPLGYGNRQEVFWYLTWPFNEYEEISCILYGRRQKVFYRTPYSKLLISGNALKSKVSNSDEEKAKLRVTPKRKKEPHPLLATGYSYRKRTINETKLVRGVTWNNHRKDYFMQYLPEDAFRGRDLIFYKGQDPTKICLNEYKIISLPYRQKYIICELMKRAEQILSSGIPICEYIEGEKITEHNIPAAKGGYISYTGQPPGFRDLKIEAWELIQTFPDDQRQFFNLFYDDENIIISRKTIKKRFSKTIEDDFWVIENPLAGKYINVPGEEKIYFQVSTLKDAARNLKMRNSKMKTLNDDGKDKLRQYFIERYGINIIRDISDKKVENKTYYFRTNFQVRELLKK